MCMWVIGLKYSLIYKIISRKAASLAVKWIVNVTHMKVIYTREDYCS
jgi:hypothetical protein